MALVQKILLILPLVQASICDYIPQWSCDFENGLCHWLQVEDDRLDFKYVVGGDVGWEDHTTNSSNGKFLYLRYESGHPDYKQNKAANLMSPILMPNNGSCKIVVHYKISAFYTLGKIQLFVNMITKDSSGRVHRSPLFQSFGTTSWKRIDVILQSNVEFQVEISAVVNAMHFGRIGIDDIWFNSDCRKNEKSSIRLVKLWSSPSFNYPAGIFYENLNGSWSAVCSRDHARSACNQLGLQDVKIGNYSSIYGHLKSGQGICLPSNITVPTSKVCNNESSCRNMTFWECKQDYIPICPELTHIACNSTVKNPVCISPNQICDYHRDCPGGEDESDCLAYKRCNFQTDMCDWMTSKKVVYEWKRYDNHTSGKYFLNVDSTHALGTSGIAKLRFKYFIQGMPNSTCSIRFSYRAIGKMHVLLEGVNSTENVWSTNSSRGHWYRAFVQLPHNRTFQLFFEASIGKDSTSTEHFGLRSVSFSRDCKFANHTYDYSRNDSSIFLCQSGEPVLKGTLCDYKVDCFDGSDESNCSHVADRCDFESSLCSWEIGTNAPEQPRRWKGRTPSYFTGPSKDHTNKSIDGYYVYMEASGVKSGAFAYLISRTMQRSVSNKCTFRLFYQLGSFLSFYIGRLTVVYKDLHTQSERKLWSVLYDQGSSWKFGSVTFNITSFLYKIIIKFERGSYYQGDIAIDDVSFAPECLQTQGFEPINITKDVSCPSVKYSVNGSTGSLYQFGSGRVVCNVTIRTDPRLRVNLYAEFFNTDSNKKVIIDAGRNGSVIYGGNFSGSLRPFSLISSTNIMTIRVPPLDGIGSHAFSFNFTSTDQPAHSASPQKPSAGSMRIYVVRDCSGRLARLSFFMSGTIQPRLLDGHYRHNERCIFKFVASNGYRMIFFFEKFDTEYKSDYIQFLNNDIIGQSQFSGFRTPFKFISKRSHVEMLFVTDDRVARSGFMLNLTTTNDDAMAATPSVPRPTVRPGAFLLEKCSYHTQPAQYTTGDSLFGEITFDRTKSSTNLLVPSNCSWKGDGTAGSKYLLEFQYIDTGSRENVLRLSYKGGKSKELRGLVNVKNLGLVQTSSQFNITIEMNSIKSSNIRMVYSTSPGCYSSAIRSYYMYKGKVASGCYCDGFKYGFLDVHNNCHCGIFPPASYGFFMQHPSYCKLCKANCRYGRLYINTDQSLHKRNQTKIDFESTSTTIVLAATLPLAVLLGAASLGALVYFWKRYRTSPHRGEAVTARTDQARNQGTVYPYAYFVNSSPIEGVLPSKDGAEKDKVIVISTLQEHQNTAQPGMQTETLAFCEAERDHAKDRPGQCIEVSEAK